MLQIWSEYIGDLFPEKRGAKLTRHKIMKTQAMALVKMKRNKVASLNVIVTETLSHLDDFRVNNVNVSA